MMYSGDIVSSGIMKNIYDKTAGYSTVITKLQKKKSVLMKSWF